MPVASTRSGLRPLEIGGRRVSAITGDPGADAAPATWRRTLRDLVRISRPRFWLYLGGTYLVGFAFGAASSQAFVSLVFVAHLLYFLVPANVFLYGINDLFDEDTDRLNPKKGAQEHRLRQDDKGAVRWAVALSALLGAVLIALQSTTAESLIFAGFLVLGAAYSAPPLRLKARPMLDFASNVLYAMPGFLGYVQASGQMPPSLALVGAAGWTGAMHLFSAIPDIEADRSAGVPTTATALGARWSLVLCTVLWLVAALSAITLARGNGAAVVALVALAALVYPALSAALLWAPDRAGRVYWALPWLNAAMGFGLFVLAVAV